MTYSDSRTRLLRGLTIAAVVLFVIGLYLALFWVGPERQQGAAQRIFYVHLGSFLGSFIAFGAAVVAGIAYLRTRNPRWDTFGLANVEVGLGMAAITIVTGMTWARPIWNTWWTWDPRLTSVAIMWLAYAAYLMLRSGIEDPERRQRFAAVYGIIAFASVLFTIIIIRVRPDTIHPVVAGPTQADPTGSFEVAGRIRDTLFFNLFTFAVITVVLVWHRIRLENLIQHVMRRKLEVLSEL
ncbi:MAG: cytochrome c biogenesis protein CcsA [Anaerolineae bacterium]|nr:cytochrome c biogenesis protein CcsA [Anaerolineae bacterium]MEB2286852.1 cytochrome c biogenesis protein CcsA [Anaerolineae bacterium]